MGIRKLLVLFIAIFFISCSRGDVSAPIVNTIRLEDGNLFLLLNNIKPKLVGYIKGISIGDHSFDAVYSKNLIIDEIEDYHHGRLDYVLLRINDVGEDLFAHEGIYVIDIESVRIEMKIEVEFKAGTFYILSEEYNSFPEYQKCEHYKNTYIEGDSK